MTTNRSNRIWTARSLTLLGASVAIAIAVACSNAESNRSSDAMATGLGSASESDAVAIITTPIPIFNEFDQDIRDAQERMLAEPRRVEKVERLGWSFVEKARAAYDPGLYSLAMLSADVMNERDGDVFAARLLRGHALHALHRFGEAEAEARVLANQRGLAMDHGLLGDVLLDQGNLEEAAAAYQRMMDLKPDSHAYMRAGVMRHVLGDLDGAARAMASAARAVSPRRAESFAWTWSQLARFQLELGDYESALVSTHRALQVQPDSAPALLQQGRVLLALDEPKVAAESLERAAESLSSPEILWTLSEALEEIGAPIEAERIRERLASTQESTDPRGLALFLASRGAQPSRSLEIARKEIAQRRDVYSWDVLAWALRSNGQLEESRQAIQNALDVGTRDGRVFLHAGVIAAESGNETGAVRWLSEAGKLRHALLPSERALLESFLYSPRSTNTSS
jgi:tetratricopeptide (TPR) repeat protein